MHHCQHSGKTVSSEPHCSAPRTIRRHESGLPSLLQHTNICSSAVCCALDAATRQKQCLQALVAPTSLHFWRNAPVRSSQHDQQNDSSIKAHVAAAWSRDSHGGQRTLRQRSDHDRSLLSRQWVGQLIRQLCNKADRAVRGCFNCRKHLCVHCCIRNRALPACG